MSIYISITLLLFIGILLFLLFRSQDGWWYKMHKSKVPTEKIILEDILKNLYNANKDGYAQRINNLVKQLPFAEKQILKMVKQMQDTHLIKHSHNNLKLTKEGKKYALRIIKAHRLWEQYLAEKTGYDKRYWHELAEKAEHRLTEEQIEVLTKELKKPLFDPHGSPIPYGETVEEQQGKPLTDYPKGTIGRIVHIQDEPAEVYNRILKEAIHISSQVLITKIGKKHIYFHSEGKDHRLDKMTAAALSILPLTEQEAHTTPVHRLSTLAENERAEIVGISGECRGENRRRLLDLGFVKGTAIRIGNISPMGDPIAYQIRETLIALRKEQAQFILIEKQ